MAHSFLNSDPLDCLRNEEPIVFSVKADRRAALVESDDVRNWVLCQRP